MSNPEFQDVLASHLPQIRRIVHRFAPEYGLADDISQECCVRLIEKESLWKEPGKLSQWMNTVARNLALRRASQAGRDRQRRAPLDEQDVSSPSVTEAFPEEQIQWVLLQFKLLPERQRQVLKMRYFDNLPTGEIAARLGVSEPTVATHHARALGTLHRKARLAGWIPGILAWCALNKGKAALAAGLLAATAGGAAYFFTTDPTTYLIARSDQLKRTLVTPHPDVPIRPGQNVLYCASFQLAWNELKGPAGGPVQLDPPSSMAERLNACATSRDDVAKDGLVAMAGRFEDGIVDKINGEVHRVFGHGKDPQLGTLPPAPAGSVLAYAFLARDLAFPCPFENQGTLDFGRSGDPVKAFGYKRLREDYLNQVGIRQDESGYVVYLKPTDPEEEILLASLQPRETLAETMKEALRIWTEAHSVIVPDHLELKVPELDFDLTHTCVELANSRVTTGPLEGGIITQALQTIRFKLDKQGATLRSRGEVVVWMGKGPPEPSLVFDHPFLLMLRRKSSARPYFALWIDNPELLIRAE